jgi:transketolase
MTDHDHSRPPNVAAGGSATALQPDGATLPAGNVAPAENTPPPAHGRKSLDEICIDTIRTLSMDAVQQADSGHPGTPMALAPVVYTLWQSVLRFDPADPAWPDRDRFVLSNGHASMVLYAVLHLAGVMSPGEADTGQPAVSLDDIKHFRQLDSRCPGHPEFHVTAGVETTTGPLGQGCGNSVGMAIAQAWLAKQFNRPGFKLFDHKIYAICGDGDMMEGVTSEAASLAGHLMLGNLCWLYDSNNITIEGHTSLAFSDDVATRFRAYGWNVLHVGDANDTIKIGEAIETFRHAGDVPTLIIIDSHIGYGAPHKHDTSAAHGEPLGVEEIRLAKRFYGWPEDANFLVPDGVYAHFAAGIGQRGTALHAAWRACRDQYAVAHPELADQLARMQAGELPDGWGATLPNFAASEKGLATRDSSAEALNAIALHYPWLIGGAADLTPSTKTGLTFEAAGDFAAGKYGGRNLHFGIREHAMGAIVNGLALSKLRPFGATFLIFSDYMKPAIRLSALMGLPSIFIFSHDSIGLGQDGPTHQAVEQLVGLRSIPNLITLRPADANEVVEAWRVITALRNQPACLVLSRQKTPTFDRARYASAAGVAQGGYVLADAGDGHPALILIGTGTELACCVDCYELLQQQGIAARVVSMPSWELFERQSQAYRDSVLPPLVTARVSVEAGSVIGWDRYVGPTGCRIGMRGFGESAPARDLMTKFGFTPEHVLAAAKQQVERGAHQAV